MSEENDNSWAECYTIYCWVKNMIERIRKLTMLLKILSTDNKVIRNRDFSSIVIIVYKPIGIIILIFCFEWGYATIDT